MIMGWGYHDIWEECMSWHMVANQKESLGQIAPLLMQCDLGLEDGFHRQTYNIIILGY